MTPKLPKVPPTSDGLTFAVRALPRSSRNEVVGLQDDGALKVKLTAPPVEGAANKALIKFLSGRLGVSKSSITIVSGQTGRNKVVRVDGITQADIERLIP